MDEQQSDLEMYMFSVMECANAIKTMGAIPFVDDLRRYYPTQYEELAQAVKFAEKVKEAGVLLSKDVT